MCSEDKINDSSKKFYFLGIIQKKYLQTYIGLLHFLSSITSLLVGNYLFIQHIALGYNNINNIITTTFHIATFLSGLTLLPFWNKVQSWQLATTSMKDKGLSATQMQNFNRGRGVICMIISPIYPLLYHHLSNSLLQNVMFSRIVGMVVTSVCIYQYTLIRDYGKILFVVYGASRLGFSLQLLWEGSLYKLQSNYPYAITFLEKEAILVVCCVEFGFLWYYLHSRKLVTKEFVQNMCKRYHPTLFFIFIGRLLITDQWWNKLPISISWIMALDTLLAALFLKGMIKSLLAGRGTVDEEEEEVIESKKFDGDRRAMMRRRRSSSIFDVQNSRTRRRSSIFESIGNIDISQ